MWGTFQHRRPWCGRAPRQLSFRVSPVSVPAQQMARWWWNLTTTYQRMGLATALPWRSWSDPNPQVMGSSGRPRDGVSCHHKRLRELLLAVIRTFLYTYVCFFKTKNWLLFKVIKKNEKLAVFYLPRVVILPRKWICFLLIKFIFRFLVKIHFKIPCLSS